MATTDSKLRDPSSDDRAAKPIIDGVEWLIGPGVLSDILSKLPKIRDERVLVGFDSSERGNLHSAVGDVEAILPRREQVPGERFRHGERARGSH